MKSAFGGRKIFNKIVGVVANISLLVGTLAPLATPVPAYASTVWNVGDVFAAIGGGSYNVYDNAGAFKETINDGLGGIFTTGCAFNNSLDKLYTTNFSNTKVAIYNDAIAHTPVTVVDTGLQVPGGQSESVVFAANGDYYVGHPDGNDDILRYDSTNTFQQAYNVPIESRGSDWMDLDSFQTTMFYTSEGRRILRYDVGADVALADFGPGLPGAGTAFALRLLPPGDGSGGLLVADSVNVKQLDGAGAVISTYDVTGVDGWFALNLDPNGTHFWAGSFSNGTFYKFLIEPVAGNYVDTQVTTVVTGSNAFFGLCLKGELTAGGKEDTRRMTGGGSVFTKNPGRVTHGFELHCDASKLPNRLEVNWDKGNKFHLENLTSAVCVDDPNLDEEQPVAGFDTYKGKGTGRYNGVSGATAEWKFTDDGEPGTTDHVKLEIKDVSNVVVLSVSGLLDRGNHQAHAN